MINWVYRGDDILPGIPQGSIDSNILESLFLEMAKLYMMADKPMVRDLKSTLSLSWKDGIDHMSCYVLAVRLVCKQSVGLLTILLSKLPVTSN